MGRGESSRTERIVYIFDPCTNREVTTFKSPEIALETSGTRFAVPVLLGK